MMSCSLLPVFLTAVVLVASCGSNFVAADLVLSKHIMDLTVEAARLSMLAYEETEPADTVTRDYEGEEPKAQSDMSVKDD